MIAVADVVEDLVLNDDRARARKYKQQEPPVPQPAAQRGDKGRNAQVRHQEGGETPGPDSEHQRQRYDHVDRQVPLRQGDGRKRAEEA